MNSKSRRYSSSTAALLAGGMALSPTLAPAALAQDAPAQAASAQEIEDDEILVTARRRAERLQDVPVAITAVTGETMDEYVVTSLTDLSRFVPGMVVGKQVTGSAASIFLRGVGSSSQSAGFDQSVTVNIAGIPMSRGRELSLAQYDIHQVEVLRGPQALYFGKNTTGGLVSIEPRRPGNEFEASSRVGYGVNGDEFYAEGIVSGPINDVIGARLAIYGNNAEGLYRNTSRPNVDAVQQARAPGYNMVSGGAQSPHRGGNESLSGRLSLTFEPNEALDVLWTTQISAYEDNGAAELYERVCGSGRTTPRPTNNVTVNPDADCNRDFRNDNAMMPPGLVEGMRYARDGRPYTDFNSYYSVLDATYDLTPNVYINSLTGFYHFRQEDMNTFNGSTRTIAASLWSDFEQFSQEVRLATDFDGALNAMFGVFYADQTLLQNGDTMASGGGLDPDLVNNSFVTYNRNSGFEGTTLSAFAEVMWNITPQLELDFGARWSSEEKDSFLRSAGGHNSAGYGAFPPTASLSDTYSEENVSPQATLSYRPNDDLSFYVAWREGFKAGGFNISATPTASATVAQNEFVSETASGWEAGVRAAFFDRNLRVNLTIFDYEYEDLQVQFFDPTTLSQVSRNAGALSTQGVEADAQFLVPGVDGLEFHSSVAYNEASYADFIALCYAGQSVAQGCDQQLVSGTYRGQDFDGVTPPKAPEWAIQFGGSYEFALTSELTARLGADLTHVTEYNFHDSLRPDAIQPEYTRADGSITIRNEDRGWRLSLIGRNLTNEHVITSTTEIPFSGSSPAGTGTIAGGTTADFQAIVDSPREVYVELGIEF